ncbi:leucine-rich repeat domain-containing protein [Niallia sp. Krafla_26]|uniref:leucine-rich repeat domain-containing protein n=1 Tax=Niallia sp. Krafla_26 TaxID=3064703 RepID=UPI003D16D722
MYKYKLIKVLAAFSLVLSLLLPLTSVRAEEGNGSEETQETTYYMEVNHFNPTDTTIHLSLELIGNVDADDQVEYHISTVPNSDGQFHKVIAYEGSPQDITIEGLIPNTEYIFNIDTYINGESVATELAQSTKTFARPYFKDTALEYEVRNHIGNLDMHKPLVDSDIESIEELYLSNADITSLEGLEKAVNLKSLTLDGNHITDLTPISKLPKLESLYIGDNDISDLSILSNLTNLEYLNLNQTNVSHEELASISKLTNLKYLHLWDNGLTDISALMGLSNLVQLTLAENQISNLSPLKGMDKLEVLFLDQNKISNLAPLGTLPNLQQLFISENQISDLSPLKSFDKLELLVANSNKISSLDNLTELDSLMYVDVVDNPLYSSAQDAIKVLEDKDIFVDYLPDDIGRGGMEPKSVVIKPTIEKGIAKIEQNTIEKLEAGDTLIVDLHEEETAKVTLTAEQITTLKEKGASLEVKNNKVELKIPLSNLPETKEISTVVKKLDTVENAVSDVYDFTIYADGESVHQFNEPITLVFNVDETKVTNPDHLKVFYFNEELSEWELVPGAVYKDGKVSVETNHFSIFTVFESPDNKVNTQDPITDSKQDPDKELEENNKNNEVNAQNPISETKQDSDQELEENDSKSSTVDSTFDETKVETTEANQNAIDQTVSNPQNKNEGSSDGEKLPNTATPIYNFLLFGTIILIAGLLLLYMQRRKGL